MIVAANRDCDQIRAATLLTAARATGDHPHSGRMAGQRRATRGIRSDQFATGARSHRIIFTPTIAKGHFVLT